MSGLYKCKRCLKDYVNRTRLVRHLKGRRVCRVAEGGEDIDRQVLIDNASNVHFNCHKCEKTFSSQSSLDNHLESCMGDECFFKAPLLIPKNPNFKNLNMPLKFIYILKLSLFANPKKRFLKVKTNGMYEIFLEGKWSEPMTKINFVNTVLNRFAKFKKSNFRLRNYLNSITSEVKTKNDFNKLEREQYKIYKNFSNYLVDMVRDHEEFPSIDEKYEYLKNQCKMVEFARESHRLRDQRKLEKKNEIAKQIREIKELQNSKYSDSDNANELKYTGIIHFEEICIETLRNSCESDESIEHLCNELCVLDEKYLKEIYDYWSKNSERDIEEINFILMVIKDKEKQYREY